MCVRKQGMCGGRIGDQLHRRAKFLKEEGQGYHRGSVNLYDTRKDFPTQEWNPQYYADRRMPWEQDLLKADYPHWPLAYNGTGIKTLRTPLELRDSERPYFEYGYSFTPKEDDKTGNRIASKISDSIPPYKYDVTRLHNPYPVWKQEQSYMGRAADHEDTTNFKRVV